MSKIQTTNPAAKISWDLSLMYTGVSDPQIDKDKKALKSQINKFTLQYKTKINSKKVTSQTLLTAVIDYENLLTTIYKLGLYANLASSVDSFAQEIKAFRQHIEEFETTLESELVWFDLEIKALPEPLFKKLTNDAKLKSYLYFLNRKRLFKPYTLSEKEEIILTKKNQVGQSAFIRFFDEKTAYLRFPLKVNGKIKVYTLSEIMNYMTHDLDRGLRNSAADAFTKALSENQHFYTFVLNTLLLDSKVSDEIRGYTYPQQATFLEYGVTQKVVESMIQSVSRSTKIVSRYYSLKKKIQKFTSLNEIDRYSPIFPTSSQTYSWGEAKNIILTAISASDAMLSETADTFFTQKRIDAGLKPYKENGAFCAYGTPQTHPYILCNYSGDLNDVVTLAHELGHGIHATLSQKNQTLLSSNPSTATAEIASIFAESLTFDSLFKTLQDKKTRLNYLGSKIEGMLATIFRQTAFYLFESDLHNHRRTKGELSSDDINNYYQKRLKEMFGKSLTLGDRHKYWWEYISHFYHYNFYVFTYAFGELLSLSLYEKFKKDGKHFMKSYISALEAGGSMSPTSITKMMGVDISDPKFWSKGLKLLSTYIDDFEKLSKEIGRG